MAIAYIHWVMHEANARPAAWRLLVVLADVADEQRRGWPSVDYLVLKTRLSESTVHRVRRELRNMGGSAEASASTARAGARRTRWCSTAAGGGRSRTARTRPSGGVPN